MKPTLNNPEIKISKRFVVIGAVWVFLAVIAVGAIAVRESHRVDVLGLEPQILAPIPINR